MNLIKMFILFIFIVLAFLITACSTTVPVRGNFPSAPEILFEKCPELKTIEGEKVSIVDFTKVVTENYTTYYQCAEKQGGWIEWYEQQKKIFESVK